MPGMTTQPRASNVCAGARAAESAATHAATSASLPTVSMILSRTKTLPPRISRRIASMVTTTSAPCTSSVFIRLSLQTLNRSISPRRHDAEAKPLFAQVAPVGERHAIAAHRHFRTRVQWKCFRHLILQDRLVLQENAVLERAQLVFRLHEIS